MIKYKRISKKFKIAEIGFGTGKLVCNNSYAKDLSLKNKHKYYINLIKDQIKKQNIICIDTAPSYSCGLSEKIIGKAIKGTNREKIFIISKIGKNYLDKKNVFLTVKQSLKRMNLKYLDLCLIHWPNSNIPLKETISALLDLKHMGLIKNIGVSNFNTSLLKEAQYYSNNQIVANQIRYNMLFRDTINTVKYCQKNNIAIIAYRPFEGGYLFKENFLSLRLCKKNKIELAMNWLLEQKNVVILTKARDKNKIEEVINIVKKKKKLTNYEKFILNNLLVLESFIRRLRNKYLNWNFFDTNNINYEI